MRMLPTTLLALLATAAPALAGELEVSSSIDTVTVYPDGATVTRVIRADLPAGDTTLTVRDFPPLLDPASLRVEGAGRLTIGAIAARAPGDQSRAGEAHRSPAGRARHARRQDFSRRRAAQVCPAFR